MIVGDLETNGLFPDVDRIHCAAFYNTITGETVTFTPETIKNIPTFMDTLPSVSFHNGIGYDWKVLKKILNYEYKGKLIDTWMLSRILFPDIEAPESDHGKQSKHSVEAWGIRFGHHKVKHDDWTKFTPEMLHRCVEDVKIQGEIYNYCVDHMREIANRDSRTATIWPNVIDLEQKVWELMETQADYGWEFDLENAYKFCDRLATLCAQTEGKLLPVLPPKVVQLTKTESGATKAFKANGELSAHASMWLLKGDAAPSGDFCKVRFEPFNLGSSQQVKDYLLKWGWEPLEYNFKKDKHNKAVRDERGQHIQTSPKSPKTAEEWEEIAHSLNNPDIALLAEYNKASHRLSQIKGLINATRQDHRIEAQANTCATNTARMAHRTVVNIPKADAKVFFGKEMRSLFRASAGKILVGCDASALEARCEAHYIYPYDKAQAELLISGDIHSLNAEVFRCDRNTAKTIKYAMLYGCGPAKVASILKVGMVEAKQRIVDYWDANSACKQLIETLNVEYSTYGYILAIDGRPLTIRYKHALLNTLLQSCGSIAMKKALVLFDHHQRRLGFESDMVGNFHDEFQIECRDEPAASVDDAINHLQYGDMIGRIAVNSIRQAGRDLGMNVPLDAEYGLGYDWSLTH